MIADTASLRPVTGDARDIERLVARWVGQAEPAALTVRTSGSTGQPKDVALSAAAMRASASAALRRLGGAGQWVLALPAHYVAGLQVVVRSVMSGTSPVVLSEYPGLAAAVAELSHQRRYLAIVPTQLYRWLERDEEVAVLRTFDAVLLGGAAVPPGLLTRARDLGIELVVTYGMSETCGGCVYNGVPLDGVALALGSAGEIRLAGPVLFDGYVGQPALTAKVLRDGWLHTPDLGRLDPDGQLEVLGRSDDVVVSGGLKIPLPVVERRVAAMPGVSEVAVLPVPDDEWGAVVVAAVVSDEALGLADVRDFVSAIHPRAWAPRRVVRCAELPMLESGKVDRKALVRSLIRGEEVGER